MAARHQGAQVGEASHQPRHLRLDQQQARAVYLPRRRCTAAARPAALATIFPAALPATATTTATALATALATARATALATFGAE